jgi:hypothetical protein
VAQQFFAEVNKHAGRFMSNEYFTEDGPLIQARASQKGFRSKGGADGGDGANFHSQKRSNKTHDSTTDGDARLYKKSYGKESKLTYPGHALAENGNGLIAAAMVTHADGYAERDAAFLIYRGTFGGSPLGCGPPRETRHETLLASRPLPGRHRERKARLQRR